MLEGLAKSFFAYLQKDPEMREQVAKAGNFVTTLDARLARIEKALGISDAQVIPLPTGSRPSVEHPATKGVANGEADKRG